MAMPVVCQGLRHLRDGFQCIVYADDKSGMVKKIIGLKEGDQITEQQAHLLATQINEYYPLFPEMVQKPENFSCTYYFDNAVGKWLIVESEKYSGYPLTTILNCTTGETGVRATVIIEQIIDYMVEIFKTVESNGLCQVGFDPKADNFLINDSSVTYCDFVPPRYKDSSGRYIIEYLTPVPEDRRLYFINRYFSPLGMIKLLLIHISRNAPKLRKKTITILREKLLANGQYSILQALSRHLITENITTFNSDEVIAKLDPMDPDGIRDIACQVAITTNGHCNLGSFREIFNLTHIDVRHEIRLDEMTFCLVKNLFHTLIKGV